VQPGNIIILNGASSSGKSSILRALQELMDEPYLDAGIDKFLWMLPRRYVNEPDYWRQVYRYSWLQPGQMVIEAAPLGHRLMDGMHRSLAALAHAGNHVVADHVLTEPAWVRQCAMLFADLPAWLVHVTCPLEVLEQREQARKDRTLGQARAQFHLVHAHGRCDLAIDTAQHDVQGCAALIKAHVLNGPRPTAFAELFKEGQPCLNPLNF